MSYKWEKAHDDVLAFQRQLRFEALFWVVCVLLAAAYRRHWMAWIIVGILIDFVRVMVISYKLINVASREAEKDAANIELTHRQQVSTREITEANTYSPEENQSCKTP